MRENKQKSKVFLITFLVFIFTSCSHLFKTTSKYLYDVEHLKVYLKISPAEEKTANPKTLKSKISPLK